ncbi:MAG: 50S ribosomal protein L10 [Campylobacterales bacterium]
MTRKEKEVLINLMTDEFAAASAIVVADYKGMTVKELEGVRRASREKGMKVRVVKNTLAKIALEKAGKSGLELKDTNIMLWGDDLLEVTKVAAKMASEYDGKFVIRGGHLDGEVADATKVIAFSKLPGRTELLGMLLSVWTGPARMFVTGLDNLRKKKEENQ